MLRSLRGGTEQTPVTLFPSRHTGGVWSVPNPPEVAKPVDQAIPGAGKLGSGSPRVTPG